MTGAAPRPPINPAAPEVLVPASVPAAAGSAVMVPVSIRHRGRIPATMRITVLGLDSRWAPEPLDLGPLQPGEGAEVTLTLVPERGALGARYPFVVAVESTALHGADSPVMGIAESVLVVDSQERISMSIQPPTPSATFGRAIRVQITNPGNRDREFTLVPSAARGASVHLQRDQVVVPAQHTVSVKGRVRIRRPTLMGGQNTHTFAVSAQGVGAPEYAEGTVRSKPMLRRGAMMAIGLVLVVALWAGLAIAFIPKISDAFKPKSVVGAPVTSTSQGPAASGAPGASGSAGQSGSGGTAGTVGQSGTGGNGGQGGAGGGTGGNGGAGGDGTATPAGYQLSGTVTGPGPKGVSITLAPTSLVGASEVGAQQAPGSSASTGNAFRAATSDPLGKIPAEALQIARTGNRTDGTSSLVTSASGEFSFAGISAPGYYLLTLAKAGFQSQRFLINSADLASPQPLKIAMVPGQGSLSGKVVDKNGAPIGAATVIITDGTVSLQTSSVSKSAQGTPGTWKVDNLSTPGSYLVTVTAPGYGGGSSLVTLGPSGKAISNIQLISGQGSITGTVTGEDGLGQFGGLGGIAVTATDGKVTRTATTVTSQALRGTFILPNMPTPGEYTLTIAGDGFLTQTRTVTLAEGVGSAVVNATLGRSDSTVQGTVTGVDSNGKSQGGLVGVGLTLTSSTTTLKTMTTSGSSAGTYRFTGVPPGTYVLTASQYGRLPSSATIDLKPSQNKTADLTLEAASNLELPATSHIRGQVVDSRTGGPLTCDRTAVPIGAKDCVVTVSVSVPVDAADASKGSTVISSSSTAALNFVYTVPALDDAKHPGLPPGLYTVTVSAPGYETTTTHVQVAQGQMAPAPQVSLPVLGIISGTITTRVGTPTAPSCVIAVPASTAMPKPLPTTCAPDAAGATCTVPGLGSQPCGLTSTGAAGQAAAGTYQVRGLAHGRYQMLVIAQDAEFRYVVSDPPIIQLELGGDGQFNAVLDRLGRIQLTAFVANRQTGALTPAGKAALTVAALPSGTTRPAGSTLDDGTATITGLDGSYTVTATSGGKSISGPSGPVGLNQTVTMTLVIAAPVGPVVGRITTSNGLDKDPVPVAGATVTITGTVDYSGSSPISGTGTVVTDAHGCYAIVPADWTAPAGQELTTPDCPDPVVADASVVAMTNVSSDGTTHPATLKTDRISIAVSAVGKLTQSYPVTSTVITGADAVRVIPSVSVLPQPVNVSPLTLTINGPSGYTAPDMSTAVIAVLNKPGLAGGVTITAPSTTPTSATGPVSVSLSFSDTNLPAPTGMPGRYALQVSLANFVSVRVDLLCEMGGDCQFVQPGTSTALTGGLLLKQLPSITGTIPVPALPNGDPDWSAAVINRVSGPTQLGNIGVVAATGDPLTGIVQFDGATSVLAAANGKYVFSVSVPGYAPKNITVTCGADFSAPFGTTGCTPLTPAGGQLTKLPTFSGSVTLAAPAGVAVPVSAATITAVDTVNTANTIQVKIDPVSGSISWQDPPQPDGLVAPGSYAITVSAPGFAPKTVPFTCVSGAFCGPDGGLITVSMLPQISGLITPAAGGPATPVDNAVVTVTKYPSNAGAITVDVDASGGVHFTDGSLPAPGTNGLPAALALPGTYTFSVSLDGYQTQSVTVVCGSDYTWAGDTGTSPAPVNGCQPLSTTLKTLPLLAGSTVSLSATTYPYDTTRSFSTSSVSVQVSPNPGSSISVTVDGSGTVNWADSSAGVQPGQVMPIPGPYTITYSLPGFKTTTATLTCAASDSTCTQSPANVKLEMMPAAAGTVTIPPPAGTNAVDLTGAIITATATNSSSVTGLKLSLSSTGLNGDGNVTANLEWTDNRLPFAGIVQPDTYSVTITVPGYQTVTQSNIKCTDYGTTCAPSFSLTLNPQPTLKLTVLPPTLTPAVLAVTGGPSGAGKVTLTADAQGNLTWQQAGLPTGVIAPGSTAYTIKVQMAGYAMVVGGSLATNNTTSFTCTTATCTFPSIVLTAATTLQIKIVDAGGNPAGTANLKLTRTVGDTTSTIGSPTTTDGTASFASASTTAVQGTDPDSASDQSYSLEVEAAGFAFADGTDKLTASSSTVTCTNGSVSLTGLQLVPGGTTTCTVTLTRLATITAATVWDIMPLTGTAAFGTNQLPAVQVTATNGTDTFAVTSSSIGALSFTGTTDIAGLKPGTWTLTASPAGYQSLSGEVTIDDANAITAVGPAADGTNSWLELVQPVNPGDPPPYVKIHFLPNPVAFQVHLQSGGADVLTSATVTLTDQATVPNAITCDTSVTPAPACVSGKYVSFASVPPGTYKLGVKFPPGTYSDIDPFTVTIKPTGQDQLINIDISAQVSSLTGGIVDAVNRTVIKTAATAELWVWGSDTGPAKDFDGNDLRVPVTNGVFTFNQIVTGTYKVVVTAPGYATGSSGIVPITYGTTPESPTVPLSVARTDVKLTFDSLAGTAIDLSGATVTLTPVSSPHVPANSEMTIPVTAAGPVPMSQVPSGEWKVSVSGQTGAPFPSVTTANLTVPDSASDGTAYETTLNLDQAKTVITVTWATVNCMVSPGSLASIPLTLTQGSGGTALTGSASATVSAGDSKAVATVFLPPGSYSWAPDLSGLPGWQAPAPAATAFTVDKPAATPDPAPTAAITAKTVPVTVKLTINGSAASTAVGAKVIATCAAEPTQKTAAVAFSSGAATLNLAAANWNFSISDVATGYIKDLADQNAVAVTAAGPNVVNFVAFSLKPVVDFSEPAGRPSDSTSRTITAAVYPGTDASGTAVWTAPSGTAISGSDKSFTGPTVIVSDTGASQSYYLAAATSDSPEVFGSGSSTVTVGGSQSAVKTMTAHLAYTAAMLEVTVSGGPSAAAAGATLTLATGGDTISAPVLHKIGAKTTFFDLAPSTQYTVSAAYTDSADHGNTYSASATPTTGAAGSTTAVPVPLTAATTSVTLQINAPTGGGGAETGVGATVTLSSGGTTVATGTAQGTGTTKGLITLSGLAPSTTYDLTATYTTGGKTYNAASGATVTSPAAGTGDLTGTPIVLALPVGP